MSQRQNDTRLMCEYPIFGTVSDVSHMNTGVIYVRPCYFKQGVDKEVALFLRDAKKERWATKDNLTEGVEEANLDNIETKLSAKDRKTLLKERIKEYQEELEKLEDEDEDDDEDWSKGWWIIDENEEGYGPFEEFPVDKLEELVTKQRMTVRVFHDGNFDEEYHPY